MYNSSLYFFTWAALVYLRLNLTCTRLSQIWHSRQLSHFTADDFVNQRTQYRNVFLLASDKAHL